jgi:hypothetical protein
VNKLFLAIALCFTLALPIGCNLKSKPLPPGAINTFDASSFDILRTTQGAIEGFNKQFADLPASQQLQIKPALNMTIQYYDAAESAWQDYHRGGGTTSAALSAAINKVVSALADLESKIGGGK